MSSSKAFPIALLAALVLSACGGGDSFQPVGAGAGPGAGGPPFVVDSSGISSFNAPALGLSLATLPIEALSAAEQASLVWMREEEKLAHDVYAQMDAKWGAYTRAFGNIATSESTHTEAVRQLLLRYSLSDPAATLAAGVFQNATLQGLHSQLVVTGNVSLVDALKVGAAVEEIDIVDLNAALLSVDNQDIRLVYTNLHKGSRNHLRAFVGLLLNLGVTYVPQYMDLATYTAMVSAPTEP
ncbi:MAG: DUF2202 domain-containing protein [Rhodoferax sp.]|nr:DUF2202 domain-containing protein [Rhodoferax sp.]